MAVAAAKKKKRKRGAGWSWRLAGIALCAFFALGVITGLSQSGRIFAIRVETLLNLLPSIGRSGRAPANHLPERMVVPGAASQSNGRALVLVERDDGFYTLDADGELRGPLSPSGQGDLPVLSGSAAKHARGGQLLEYVSVLVRAEAGLSEMASEMSVGDSGEATLYLDHPPLAVALELDDNGSAIARAARVLNLWRRHRELIERIDVTTPGQAVVRLKTAAFAHPPAQAALRNTSAAMPLMARRPSGPAVTASR